MQTSELKALYKEACKAMRQEPEEAEFKMWKHVLGGHDERDVRGALMAWQAGRRGMYLPKPAELKPEAESLARIRRKAEMPDFCNDSALGWCLELLNGKLTKVKCQCVECVSAWAALATRNVSG